MLLIRARIGCCRKWPKKGLNLSVGERLISCKVKAEGINLDAAMLNVNIS